MTPDDLIEHLGLEPHPEGGWYARTYTSDLPHGTRPVATAIYYLVTAESFSAMHRLRSDEVFHHYLGGSCDVLVLRGDGTGAVVGLGPGVAGGDRPQVVVPAGTWQGVRVREGGSFALLGCTVAPGFDFADLELGDPLELATRWPDWEREIRARSR